jgi:hypothetical protein
VIVKIDKIPLFLQKKYILKHILLKALANVLVYPKCIQVFILLSIFELRKTEMGYIFFHWLSVNLQLVCF